MPTQRESGKAFEYALINEAYNILSVICSVTVIKDINYTTAIKCFNVFNGRQQLRYSQAAIAALNHIITLEPRLTNLSSNTDKLTMQLLPDAAGQTGDVRDVLFIRSAQKWEIGISAKNNHSALKHSRLSIIKDFGTSWVGIPCSLTYFAAITPIFTQLATLRGAGAKWNAQANKHGKYYQPILNAFRDELTRIDATNPNIPQALASYLIGTNDFYKVMKRSKAVEVMAFNLHGTLGKSINQKKSTTPIKKLALPTQIIRFQMMAGKTDTLSMICDQGWQLSFRIHSAETLVAASLKFDINLLSNPTSMYSNHIPY